MDHPKVHSFTHCMAAYTRTGMQFKVGIGTGFSGTANNWYLFSIVV